MKVVVLALGMALAAGGAYAGQRQHPSMQLPSHSAHPRPPGSRPKISPPPPAAPRSPFDARPGTYAPRYDNVPRRSGYGVPFYPGVAGFVGFPGDDSSADVQAGGQNVATSVPPVESPRISVTPPEPSRPAEPHAPDTFYVIPGCYMGNRPPNPARLPKGCEMSRLRTTPVR